MKKTQKAIFMAALMLTSTSSLTFAATADTAATTTATTTDFAFSEAPTATGITANSVEISWPKVDGSTGYMVHYGTKSAVSDGKYENDSDLIDATETGATLEKLEAKTTYYAAVSAYDKDANESPLSEEITFTTADTNGAATTDMNSASGTALSIKSVNVTATNKLEVVFSAELDNSPAAKREFKLASKDGAEIAISSVELTDANKLSLTLASNVETSKDYTLTVLALNDKDGNSIQAGVDGQFAFTTPETIEGLDAATASGNAAEVATDAKALPKTGPEQFLIFALAMILGLIVLSYRKKIS